MNRRLFLAAAAGILSPRLAPAAPPTVTRHTEGHNFIFASDVAIEGVYPLRELEPGDSPGFHPSNIHNRWKLEILRPWFPDGPFTVRVEFKNGAKMDYKAICNKGGVFFLEEISD